MSDAVGRSCHTSSDRRPLDPTRSGPARAAATPGPPTGAVTAARPGPLHPTRRATAAGANPSAGPR
ncbi:MAG: hypothetical protein JO329_23810 [Planctomycetaceae bacterium]|nr:hypothetical protein [Planctomycetaceae bacterium]MBV8558596.1 hypothetical protein [Planctomycetaceae bacterium]MBV8610571.1 hypothetical protein [Singulisphaera sp.]